MEKDFIGNIQYDVNCDINGKIIGDIFGNINGNMNGEIIGNIFGLFGALMQWAPALSWDCFVATEYICAL